MFLPLRQLHLRAHLHGLPHRHVLPHHVRFSFLFNFCSMCLQKSLLFPKIPLWHEIIPNAESNNIFCDLSKLRSNFEGDDANPFLWDTPTPLYMQHKHIVTRYTRFSKYHFRLEGIPTSNAQSKCYCLRKFPGLDDCCCQWCNHFLKIFIFC